MVSGGKRKGAGRKKSEPTKQVRVPLRGTSVARGLVGYYLRLAEEIWQENQGAGSKSQVYLDDISSETLDTVLAGSYDELIIYAYADIELEKMRYYFKFNLAGKNYEYGQEYSYDDLLKFGI